MDTGIPALVIAAILIVAGSLTARSQLVAYDRLGQSSYAREVRAGEQARTRLTIDSATLDGAGDTLTALLTNDGQTRIAFSERMDLIVSYFAAPAIRVDVRLPFAASTGAPDTWGVASIADDAFEPGLLNPGETATLQIELATPVAGATTNQLVITAENGVTASAPFTN